MSKDDRQWQIRSQYMSAVGTIYSVSLGFFVVLSMMFVTLVGQVQQPKKAEAATCSLPTTITTTIELTPDNSDNIIDCSAQDITIAATGKLIIKSFKTADTSSSNDGGVVLKVGNLTIEFGGEITADGQGYVALDTDGGTALVSTGLAGGSGGGHGGAGGSGNTSGGPGNTVGETGGLIGNKDYPITLGGAGGNSGGSGAGGNGGGAIKIESTGTVTIDGKITANGLSGVKSADNQTSGGGGAGGSIWVEAQILAGSGQVTAQGGGTDNTASYYGGGGGGGRVALICTASSTFPSGNASVSYGTGSQNGQIGTLVGPGCKPPEPTVLKFFEKNASSAYVDRELLVSDLTSKTSLTFASDLVGSNLKLEIELREKSQSFTNIATNAQVSAASNKSCSGMPSENGVNISTYCGYVEVTTGLVAGHEYKWQARIVSDFGRASNWVQFGGNATSEKDFQIVGAPTQIVILEGNNQSATVGHPVAVQPKVRVVDAAGNGIPFYAFSAWSVLSGGGSLSNSVLTADKWGEVTSDWTLGTVGGVGNNTMSISQSSDGLSATFTASAVPGVIQSYTVTTESILSVINTPFTYTITAKDSYGNLVPLAHDLTVVPVSSNDDSTPGLGSLTPETVPADLGNTTITVTNGSYNYSESIKLKVYDSNGVTAYSRSILFVSAVGSCPAITIDTNQTWNAADVPGGVFDCRGLGTLTVKDGYTLSLLNYDNGDGNVSNDYGVTILADNMKVESGGALSTDGTSNAYNAGAYGGYANGTPYGSVYEPTSLGASGWGSCGGNGKGGGSVKLVVNGTVTINGVVSANGSYPNGGCPWYAQGGSGGSIWLDIGTLAGSGIIRTNGSTGGNANGSGGRIAVYYTTNSGFTFDNSHIQSVGAGYAGPGTIYLENKGVHPVHGGVLMVDDAGSPGGYAAVPHGNYAFAQIQATNYGYVEFMDDGGASTTEADHSKLTLTSGAGIVGDNTLSEIKVTGVFEYTGIDRLTVNGVSLGINGKAIGINDITIGETLSSGLTLYATTWFHSKANPYHFGDLHVTANGTITMVPVGTSGVYLETAGITLDAGGSIVSNASSGAYNAGAYGGYANGTPYGSVYEPESLGAAGWASCGGQGYGGGAIIISATGTATIDGLISANGSYPGGGCPWYAQGGSGGSIFLNVGTLAGSGLIRTNGSSGGNGHGSGGRIAVYYADNTGYDFNNSHIQSFGVGYAGPGTIYLENKGIDQVHGGTLMVDNGGGSGGYAAVPHGDYSFKKIVATNYGRVEFMDDGGASTNEADHSKLTLTSGAGIAGDNTMSDIKISGVLQYTSSERLTIDGVSLGINGKATGINDVTIGATLRSGITLYAITWFHSKTNPYHFGDVLITPNGTMTMVPVGSSGVFFESADLTLQAGGYIGTDASSGAYNAGAYGGYANGTPYGSVFEPESLGSSGWGACGGQGYGGGAMKLTVSGTATIDGTISSNGSYPGGGCPWYAQGGSGGSIYIDAHTIAGSGLIRTNGSSGGNGHGSGGRIAIYYTTNSSYDFNNSHIQSFGVGYTGPGTIYLENRATNPVHGGSLLVDNAGQNGGYAAVPHGDYSFAQIKVTNYGHVEFMDNGGASTSEADHSKLVIAQGNSLVGDSTMSEIRVSGVAEYTDSETLSLNGVSLGINGKAIGINNVNVGGSLRSGLVLYAVTWFHSKSNPYHFGDIVITPNGTMTMASVGSAGVFLEMSNLTLDEGGYITSDRYSSSYNAGAYGGSANGTPYGSVFEPESVGSRGWDSCGSYGAGGGAMKLTVSGTAMINGAISSNGGNPGGGCPWYAQGGSGGSIWIDTNTLAGSGLIRTNGASGGNGHGSGGRIAVYYATNSGYTFNNTHIQSYGVGYTGPGTIYVEDKAVNPVHGGTLLVDNAGQNGGYAGILHGDYNFAEIKTQGYGNIYFFDNGGTSLTEADHGSLTIQSNDTIVADSSSPYIQVNGVLNFAAGDGVALNTGAKIYAAGKLNGVNNLVLGTTKATTLVLYANTWFYNKQNAFSFGSMQIGSLGTLNLLSYQNGGASITDDYGVSIQSDTLSIAEGGKITADFAGYPGQGIHAGSYGGSNATYGDIFNPVTLGNGGAIKLNIATNTLIDGVISANGDGSGGSIWLETGSISGSGSLTTNGAGNSSGGRIALYYDTNTGFSENNAHIKAFGAGSGGPGTVYIENRTTEEARQGDLRIDNDGRTGRGQDFASGIYQFHDVTIGQNVSVYVKSDPTKVVDALSAVAPHSLLPTNSDVLSYNFDDTTATSFADASGNGHTATAGKTNTIAVPGKFGNAQKIGAGDLGLTFTEIALPGDYSLDMWVKFPLPATIDGWNTLIRQEGGYHNIIVHPNGQLGMYYGGFYDSGFSVLGLSKGWHHVAVVASGSTTHFYVDGNSVGSAAAVIHNSVNVIGNASINQQAGGVDEVRIQDKAMTGSEVLVAAEATVPLVTSANTLALWHLDEDNYSRMDSSADPLMTQEIGAVTTINGKFGNGRNLAIGQVIKTEPITLGSDWTIDMWASFPLAGVNPQGGWRTMAARSDGGTYPIMIDGSGNMGTYTAAGWYPTSYNVNALSGWHHVAAIGTGTATNFYIDGTLVGTSQAKETGTINAFGNIEVSGAPYPSGGIDEVRVRNIAVSESDILLDANAHAAPVANNNTLLLLHFNAPAAKTIADASSNALNGTLFGTAAAGGEFGSSRMFTGLRDYVQVPSSTMDFTNGMTISLWANPTSNAYQARFVDFGNGCPVDNIIFYREGSSSNLIFIVYQGGSYTSYVRANGAIINNEWHQYTATMDASGNGKIYRDGEVVGSGTVNIPNTVARNTNYIGKSCSGSEALYTGYLDELHIFNKGFDEEQVRAVSHGLTDAEYSGFQSKLIGQGVRFELTGNFTLSTGASIVGTGIGFASDNGAGRGGRGVGYSGGAGGSNGGSGGQGQSDGSHQPATGGVKFGDQLLPITLGAGGGSSGVGALGGEGGGAFGVIARGKLDNQGHYVDGEINILGSIIMDGTEGKTGSPGGGGGSGGSILLHGNTCSITGNLSAKGGAGGNSDIDGGSGGGGRISVLYNVGPCDVSGTVNVTEGTPADAGSYGAQVGQVGTYPPEPNSVPWPSQYREQFEVTEDVIGSREQGLRVASADNSSKEAVLGTSENVIPVGGIINGTNVTLKADAYDAGARPISPKHLRIQVELKKVVEAFDGTTGLHESNTIVFAGGAPVVLSISVSNLEMGASYKWRVRTANVDTGLYSEWQEYGGNSSSVADFTITTVASLDLTLSKSTMELPDSASITVTAKDSDGSVDTSYRGTVLFTSSSSTAVLPSSYTFTSGDAGTHTFTNVLKFYEIGTFSVTAEDTINLVLLDTAMITVNLPPVPFISLSSSADLVTFGGKVTLTWLSNYLSDVTIDQGVGPVSETGNIEIVPPLGTTTYTIQGRQQNGSEMTASVTVTATLEIIPTTATPTPTPTTTTVLTVTPTGDFPVTLSPTPTLTATSTPKVTARPRPTTVVVSCPIITTLTVSNRIVKKGDAVTISWQVQNADRVSIDSFSGSLSSSGSASVILNKTQDITLYASKGTCKRTEKSHVEVVNSYPWEGAGGMLIGLFALETIGLQIGVTQGNIWFALLGLIDRGKKRKPWGVVYNAVTKALLSRVVVRLWDATTGKLVDTVVTDANGIFKLTPKKGKYVVKVSLAGFIFPSKLINTDTDTGFTNIYTGEVIEILENNEILMISIPVDPVKKQKSVLRMQQIMNFLEEIVGVISPIILVAGFAYSIVVTVMYPLSLNYIILALYAFTFLVKAYVYISRPKLFGMVNGVDGRVVSGLEVGLFDKEFKNLISRTFTNKQGAYNFVVKNQEYYLQIMDPGYKMLNRSMSKDGLLIKRSSGNSGVKLVTENLIVYPVQNLVKK